MEIFQSIKYLSSKHEQQNADSPEPTGRLDKFGGDLWSLIHDF